MSRVDAVRTEEDYRTNPFNPVVTLEELETFQTSFGITLPQEYVEFLTTIGNGGMGPYSGLLKLSEAVAHLKEFEVSSFPYTIQDGKSYRG